MEVGDKLSDEILRFSLKDANSKTKTLSQILHPPSLIVFLRHYGCIGCAAHMRDLLPRVKELKDKGVQIILVGNGKEEFIESFFDRFQINANIVECYSDTDLGLYKLFHLKNGGAFDVPSVWNVLKFWTQGLTQDGVKGDINQQGGVFLIGKDKKIYFAHKSKSLGDNARTNDVMKYATQLFLAEPN